MVLAYLMDETQPLGLEPLAMRYLGVAGWKDEGRTAEPGSFEFQLYNARDALYTARLYKIFKGELGERIKIADYIIGPGQQALAACSARGLRVSLRAVEEAERFYSDRARAARHDLQLWGIENPNATRQLTDCLVSQGYDLTEETETGELKLDKEVLSKLPQTPLVESIREYKFAEKRRQMVEPYRLAALSEDGRVHPEYTVVRTATGRTSARKPNVQQVARDPIMRAMLPGGQADYSAIEFRLAAWIAREEGVLERFRQDPFWDPHRWFAALYYNILEEEVTDDQRQVAKSANFGLLFKALPPTLVDYTRATTGIVLPLAEAARIRQAWLKALPGFPQWWGRTETFIKKHGYAESPTGRRRHFGPPIIVKRSYNLAEFVREGVNSQVQGFAADVALLGLHGAHINGLPITGFYHDAISFDTEVEPELVARNMLAVPKSILGDRFGIDLDIPLAIELKQNGEKHTMSYLNGEVVWKN
jgi:DNA polymerase-1